MNHVRGASRLEFAVAVAIIGLLGAALLVRLKQVEAQAERTQVELTIRNIRVGIQLAIGEKIMSGREDRIIEVANANPIDLLGGPAPNTAPGHARIADSGWAYDSIRKELKYQPRQPEAFGGADELRWRYVATVDPLGRIVGVDIVGQN